MVKVFIPIKSCDNSKWIKSTMFKNILLEKSVQSMNQPKNEQIRKILILRLFSVFKLKDYCCLQYLMNRKHSSLDHSQQKIHKTLQSEGKLNTQMNLIKNQENQETYKTQENHQKQKSCFHPIEFMADFFSIYKFGDKKDEYLMVFGIFLAILSGVAFPLFMYIWGKEVDHVINDYLVLDKTLDLSRDYYLAFLALGLDLFQSQLLKSHFTFPSIYVEQGNQGWVAKQTRPTRKFGKPYAKRASQISSGVSPKV